MIIKTGNTYWTHFGSEHRALTIRNTQNIKVANILFLNLILEDGTVDIRFEWSVQIEWPSTENAQYLYICLWYEAKEET